MQISFLHSNIALQNVKCSNCDQTMRLVGIEPHPTVESVDLVTFECACGEVTAESRIAERRVLARGESMLKAKSNGVIH
jgi:hypothetical protein